MGLFDKVFASQVQKQVNEQLSLYNLNAFKFINDGSPIYLDDKAATYIDEGYLTVGSVFEAVNLIMKKVVASPPVVYEVKNEAKLQKYRNLIKSDSIESKALALQVKAQAVEEVEPGEIMALLNKPNPLQSYKDYIRQLTGWYLLTGEAIAYQNGPSKDKVTESFPLPPHIIDIISGGMFQPIKEYILKFSPDTQYAFPTEQVRRIKMFNPLFDASGSQLRGMSPLRSYLNKLARVKAGDKEVNKQLNNGGSYGFLAPKNAEDFLTPEQRQALTEKLKKAKASKDEVGRILTSTIALEFQQIGLPIGDLQLLEILQGTDEDIYRAYSIPLVYRSTDASTMNNEQHASKKLIYDAVQPIAEDIGELLTRIMCEPVNKRTGKKYYIELDTSSLPEMQNDMKALTDWLEKAWWIPANMKLEMQGFGRIDAENMDIPLAPKNLVRVDMLHLTDEGFSQAVTEPQE